MNLSRLIYRQLLFGSRTGHGKNIPFIRNSSLHAASVFCTAEQPALQRKQRPSKTASKRKVQQLQLLAAQLCKLSERQLERLSPLLDTRALDAIAEAKLINGKNQARSRQEAFVAKVLREELDEEGQAHLQEAVVSVKTGQGVIINPAVEMKAQVWLEGLICDDQVIAKEVYTYTQDQRVDMQLVRQLVRQLRAAQQNVDVEAGSGQRVGADAKQVSRRQRIENDLRLLLRRLAEQAFSEANDLAQIVEN